MSRVMRVLCLIMVLALAIPSPVLAQKSSFAAPSLPPTCQQIPLVDQDSQKVTETYLICMPPDAAWNGSLVVFAHGYVMPYPPTDSPTLPLDQIATPDGLTTLPGMINALGFGFAMTSYTKNGLAVKEGVQNTIDLVSYVRALKAPAEIKQVFIVGASEGGLITTQLIEGHPDLFQGGVAVCGPIGDFRKQIDYWGDFRAVFDYYFPGVLPQDAVTIPEDPLMIDWVKGASNYTASTYQSAVINAMSTNFLKTQDLFNVSGAPYIPGVLQTYGSTALGILNYNVLATNEAKIELGLQPFDNASREYTGSSNDTALNDPANGVKRYTASGDVTAALQPYQTTGLLQSRLITMHNTMDPIVPFWHEAIYQQKVAASGSTRNLVPLTVNLPPYGHCNFKTGQMFYAFARLIHDVNYQPVHMTVVQAVLQDQTAIKDFTDMNTQYGDVTTVKLFMPAIRNLQ